MNWTFWYTWPSWVVELISGTLTNFGSRLFLAILAFSLGMDLNTWVLRLIVAFAMSIIYEKYKDPNGWDLGDVAQRGVGIVGAELVFDALKVLT